MIIQYCSDLHLEFNANKKWLKENPIQAEGEILIIAGDLFYLDEDFKNLTFLDYLSQSFTETYILPGNHEYYGGYDVELHSGALKKPLRDNVWLVNNCVVEKPNIRLIFSTLWSRIEKNITAILFGMVDFRRIYFQKQRLTIDHYNFLHNVSLEFLKHELQVESPKKQLVISHHLPSELCNAVEFKGSQLNEAFCVDLTPMIMDSNIDAWIYGHSHRNIPEFRIGKTLMLTNQLGYVDHHEHYSFRRNGTLKI
ncbi:metallophosphoesterase [Catalinimonas sp. 4WD22]|uniref:metallophosphoesterase n=1 Tax=Catalinimonas locisalis TaxID=3133978 RepID=UPI0031011D8C